VPEVAGHFVAKDPAFEALHPRDRSGTDRGQFVDVLGRMAGLGGVWDEARGVWMVPSANREQVDAFLKDTGFDSIDVPEGMRALRPEDAGKKFGPSTKIPPGWTDVFVSDNPSAAVQVIGRDAKGRRQAIYSREHTEGKSAEKFGRIAALEGRMPAIDARLKADAMTDDTAAAMLLVRKMGLRPGSTSDTGADKQAYGASTLLRRHVSVTGDTVRLQFVGKKGVNIDVALEDGDLAAVLKKRMTGKAGDDRLFSTSAERMNRWVGQVAGPEFSVKDFRTRLGTIEARKMVQSMPAPTTAAEHRKMQLKVGAHVSSILGNNRKQALESYIDPSVFGPVPGEAKGADLPAGAGGRAALKSAFDGGVTEGAELGGGHANLSIKRVTLSDGSEAVLKVPQDAGEHRREVVAGVVQNALGIDGYTADVGDGRLLTTFVGGEPGGSWTGKGNFTGFQIGSGLDVADGVVVGTGGGAVDPNFLAQKNGVDAATLPGGREIGVLDWLIRNRDRHGMNWMVTPEGRVAPIDHGLTFFGVEGADRDIPMGPFAAHWLGLDQKPTSRPARGKSNTDGMKIKGSKARLRPQVSKAYVAEVRRRMEASRTEFSDAEWEGLMVRLDMLESAAPETIDGELPLEEMA
jgi:DNA topoisomerase-1